MDGPIASVEAKKSAGMLGMQCVFLGDIVEIYTLSWPYQPRFTLRCFELLRSIQKWDRLAKSWNKATNGEQRILIHDDT